MKIRIYISSVGGPSGSMTTIHFTLDEAKRHVEYYKRNKGETDAAYWEVTERWITVSPECIIPKEEENNYDIYTFVDRGFFEK